MSADVDIVYATHPDVIVIPDDALVRRDGKQVVFVVENSVANKRDVEVGIRTDNLSEILSGLSPGEEIVTTNADLLDGGEKVIPLGR
jgi:multidrug efflux pump subunit AcrA (membrane-fusion protein)